MACNPCDKARPIFLTKHFHVPRYRQYIITGFHQDTLKHMCSPVEYHSLVRPFHSHLHPYNPTTILQPVSPTSTQINHFRADFAPVETQDLLMGHDRYETHL